MLDWGGFFFLSGSCTKCKAASGGFFWFLIPLRIDDIWIGVGNYMSKSKVAAGSDEGGVCGRGERGRGEINKSSFQ